MNSNELQPTPASAFKESATKMVVLPTGRVVQIQRLNLFALLEQGLLPVLEKLDDLRKQTQDVDNVGLLKLMGSNKNVREFIEALLLVGVVTPRLTKKSLADADEEEVSLQALTNEEIATLVNEVGAFAVLGVTVPFLPPKLPDQNLPSSTASPPDMGAGPAS